MKALVLINESAGTGKMGKECFTIIDHLAKSGYETTVYPIAPKAGRTSEKIMEGRDGQFDLIVCAGGDGTLNHVIDGLVKLEPRPILGYIPAGSTNDFAKGMGITGDINRILRILTEGEAFAYDIGAFNDRHFNYVAAFGAFVEISYATDQRYKNMFGHAAYILNGISKLQENISYSCHMRVEIDDHVEEGDYLFGAVYSTISIGGMSLRGEMRSELCDGELELLLVRKPNNIVEVEQIASKLLSGRTDSPYLVFRKIKKASFHCDQPVNWTLDGEFGGSLTDAEIEVQKEAIKIMTP